jgi:hypothetical protein
LFGTIPAWFVFEWQFPLPVWIAPIQHAKQKHADETKLDVDYEYAAACCNLDFIM